MRRPIMKGKISRALWVAFQVMAIGLVGAYLWTDYAPTTAEAQTYGSRWECGLDGIGATLTLCVAAPTSGEARYITDIVAQSTTTTAGLMLVRTGTGTNCGTSTLSLFPAASTVARIAYSANTLAPTVIPLRTPLRVPPNADLCVIGTGTNTVTIQFEGYVAP
jgi:hypothetical protein